MQVAKELIGAAGTAVGVAVGALLVAFKDDIKNIVLSMFSSQYAYLQGAWTCTWDVTTTAGQGTTITDQVAIEKVRGSSLKGAGNNVLYGRYNIDGKIGTYVITLQYDGEEKARDLVGVVMLKRISSVYLQGVWSQYADKGDLKGGTTEWRR